ncbi:ABC transporter permease [Microbaculum marinisediminis]|uniref:ABC transporter permease n=1 Tax=Microbaculum marinisediminis TaxID=2931392 RepID=A0AAW5R3R1_9HYPH|nr:ABC transporter permease [Microbaculum sp. A6E488]MCT8973782.1 ABC transporter permease [Microbaculum sp. A6E488]
MPDLQGFGPMLAQGALMTIQVALFSAFFGVLIGIVVAMMKLSSSRTAQIVGDAYTTIVRGVPALVLILLIYFGGIRLVNEIARSFGHEQHIELNAFVAGVFALSLAFGAYATEVFRGAFQSIPKGQIDAARALGMGRWLTFRRISLPQVWRIALPGLGNIFLVILKETALVSVIGLEELMRKTEYAVGFTRQPFTFFLAAAFIYLAMTIVSMLVLQALEQRAARGNQPMDAA